MPLSTVAAIPPDLRGNAAVLSPPCRDCYIDLQMELTRAKEGILSAVIPDDGLFPNSRLPLVVYPGGLAARSGDLAAGFERLFMGNSWGGTWRNGIYSVHHYHSTAHEVLGICGGSGLVRLGGETGVTVTVQPGDCVVIPAGVAHKLLERTAGFLVVGAYPAGQSYDVCYGRPGERPGADRRIESVPLPALDPVRGKNGPLLVLWGEELGG